MEGWRCRKTINMDEALYNRINELLPSGLQSRILGLILEDFFNSLPKEDTMRYIGEFISRSIDKWRSLDANFKGPKT